MKRKIGFLLLAVAYLASMWMAVSRMLKPLVDDRIVIRIAHWQLESGVREAMDAVIHDYEKLNPRVKVVQMIIPDVAYKQWLQAQLAGGNCPELVEYGFWFGRAAELQARYFAPIDGPLSEPNPYNAGTELANTPWRQTFLDALDNPDCYNKQMSQFFGFSLCTGSFRIFYNKTLFKEITGRDDPPKNFKDFLAVCAEIKAYAKAKDLPIVPVAGSKITMEHMGGALIDAVAMKRVYGLDYLHRLQLDHTDIGIGHLRGEWSYRDPEFLAGLTMARLYSQQLDPGATQLERDSATMKFANSQAVMFGTGNFDASSLKVICPFDVSAFRVPFPGQDDPDYGKYMLDYLAEAKANTGFTFYTLRESPHRAEALDFARYLTSQKAAQKFADLSGWLSGIVGGKPTAYSKPYMPDFNGYGTTAATSVLAGPDCIELFKRNAYLLSSHTGSAEQFADVMEANLPQTIHSDMTRLVRDLIRNQNEQDVALAARWMLQRTGADTTHDLERENSSSTLTEARTYRYQNATLHPGEKAK